mmetsp:Transcript_2692/g.6982  ORF Transcript_2692/g.6982 Transcript_2692/m.6982 type:complete len:331 (+) Transcript_2692:293-1285(+)
MSGIDERSDDQSVLFERTSSSCERGAARDERRRRRRHWQWRGVDLVGAARRRQDYRCRGGTLQDLAGAVDAHDRDRRYPRRAVRRLARSPGRIRRRVPKANRRGPGGGQVRPRARGGVDGDERRRQSDERSQSRPVRRRPRRLQSPRDDARGYRQAAPRPSRTGSHRHGDGRQRVAALGRCLGLRRHGCGSRREARRSRPWLAPGLRRRRMPTRRDGRRPRPRRAQVAQASRPHRRRHRPLGDQRGLCLRSPLRHPRAPHRPGQGQRQRREHRHRPSLWDDGKPHGRPRPHRRPASQGQAGRRYHVHRRRHGCRGLVRGRRRRRRLARSI